jgi:uncharacterized protein YndB with AHSA1/START domain
MPDILQKFPVSASKQKVFDAFATPQGLDSWWTLRSAGTPESGAEYTFYFGPEYDWRAKVVRAVPGKSLTWRMTQAREDWMGTEVGFDLTDESGGTSVLFFHHGWREASEHFAITTYCWGQLLKGLKDFAERGVVIPFANRN